MNKFLLFSASVFLFTICLFEPAVEFEKVCENRSTGTVEVAGIGNESLRPREIMSGLYLLLAGGIGVLFAQFGAVGWLANPLYFTALAMSFTPERGMSRLFAIGSLVLAVVSLKATNWFPITADEGGVCYFSALQAKDGYWFWLWAIGLLNAHVWVRAYNKPIKPTP